eukprot:20630-Heterococcus_DN1.PRE.2
MHTGNDCTVCPYGGIVAVAQLSSADIRNQKSCSQSLPVDKLMHHVLVYSERPAVMCTTCKLY